MQSSPLLRSCPSTNVFGNASFLRNSPCASRPAIQHSIRAEVKSKTPLKKSGGVSEQGTIRKRNEDRLDLQVENDAQPGQPFAYAGVFDGHGGIATSDWLSGNFWDYLQDSWSDGRTPEKDITAAFLEADKALLATKKGAWGSMGERGVGGAKVGSTGAVAVLYRDRSGKIQLLTANAGDSRVILAKDGKAVQLTQDHVPDMETERQRIEATNPNPKRPLVRYVAGTWRVGGILALSRAFGDAYLKGSGQFEGVAAGSDGYGSGFGVIADPYVTLTQLSRNDTWVIVASDGLFENNIRGGGGGLENQEIADLCLKSKESTSARQLARELVEAAVKAGTTDDVSVALFRLSL